MSSQFFKSVLSLSLTCAALGALVVSAAHADELPTNAPEMAAADVENHLATLSQSVSAKLTLVIDAREFEAHTDVALAEANVEPAEIRLASVEIGDIAGD